MRSDVKSILNRSIPGFVGRSGWICYAADGDGVWLNRVLSTEDDDIVLGSTTPSRWSYACSKAIDEFPGLAFYQKYGLGVVIGSSSEKRFISCGADLSKAN
jgi:hypothetical protein